MEDIQKQLKNLMDRNNETSMQYSILKRGIPYLYEVISLMAYPKMVGRELDEFVEKVKTICWNSDIQNRRVFAIVQAYGCGKTKMGLMLAKQFIVLPWRTLSSSSLIKWLIMEQKKCLPSLEHPTYQEVESFSNECLHLLELLLLGHIALFNEIVSSGILDENNDQDRFYFALMLLNANDNIAQWIITWVEQNRENSCDVLIKELVKERKIIFVIDEVHEMINICRGYCLHRGDFSTFSNQAVQYWRREQTENKPAENKRHCTDLFYQLRYIMLARMQSNPAPFGFVMCSTEYRTWESFQIDHSPFTRGMIEKVYNLHYFSKDEVQNILLEFLKLDDSTLDHADVQGLCAYLVRPLFVADFMHNLFANLKDSEGTSQISWLLNNFSKTKQLSISRAMEQLRTLDSVNYSAGELTPRGITRFLYTVQRLCGGTFKIVEGSNLSAVIAQGVACISHSADRFRLVDPVFIEALFQHCTRDNDFVISQLCDKLEMDEALVSQDESSKGFLVERALSWIIQEHGIPYPSNALSAGTTMELFGSQFLDQSEASLLTKIAEGEVDKIVFPSKFAGPDILYRAKIDDNDYVVSIQSKCHGIPLTLTTFKNALSSLDPAKMFACANHADQADWQNSLPELRRMLYLRCIFSSAGFSEEVYFLVREYNIRHPQESIYLYHLDNVRDELKTLYSVLRSKVEDVKDKPQVKTITQSEWSLKLQVSKGKTLNSTLQQYCKERNIPFSKLTKKQMINELDAFDVDAALKPLEMRV